MANPFEDPDVKAASNGPRYNDSAYDDVEMNDNQTTTKSSGPPPPPNAQSNIQVQVESSVANAGKQMVTNEYNAYQQDKDRADQATSNHNERPPPPKWVERCYAWIPIRTFAFVGGWAFVILPWLDMVTNSDLTFSGFFILFYIFLFGLAIIMVESPSWKCTRKPQLGIYFWSRFMSRMWGRANFYVFVSILSYANFDLQGWSGTGLAGVYMLIVALLMYYVSWSAAKKYVRMYIYIAAGTEGDQLKEKLESKFNELDIDRDGQIGSEGIVKLAQDAGRHLTNAERHAIQTFLDESCNGSVSKDDWMRQWMEHNMKAKFL